MKQTLLHLLAILLLGGAFSGCVKQEYDLSKIDTDNISVGDNLVVPMGSIEIDFQSLVPGSGSSEITIPGTFETQTFNIGSGFDSGIFDNLDENTPYIVTAEVNNCFSEPILIWIRFKDENGNTSIVLCDEERIEGSAQNPTTLSFTLTTDDFRFIVEAAQIDVDIATIDKQPHKVSIDKNGRMPFTLSVQKSGGIKL